MSFQRIPLQPLFASEPDNDRLANRLRKIGGRWCSSGQTLYQAMALYSMPGTLLHPGHEPVELDVISRRSGLPIRDCRKAVDALIEQRLVQITRGLSGHLYSLTGHGHIVTERDYIREGFAAWLPDVCQLFATRFVAQADAPLLVAGGAA